MRAPAVTAALAAALGLGGCQRQDEPFARATVITSMAQTIGGPAARAKPGDVLIENDRIRAVVEQGGTSYQPTDVGGSLIDLDLQRPEAALRDGNGLDQLVQIAPIANLSVAQADGAPNVRITRSKQGAEVTVASTALPAFKILRALGLLIDQQFASMPGNLNMYTEYELRPGEAMIRIRTRVGFGVPFCRVTPADGCPAECDDALYDDDCDCPAKAAACLADARHVDATPLPDRPTASLLDILMGDLPRPAGTGLCTADTDCDQAAGETCVTVTQPTGGDLRVCRGPGARDAGVFLGDLLVFSGHLTPFVRGIGRDVESDIRRRFDLSEDTLSSPVVVDAIFATGDRVSIGYMSPDGDIEVPIFRGPFSLGATHAASCPTGQRGCLEHAIVSFERWVSVGDGTVASAQAPFLAATGAATGRVHGVVRDVPAGTPHPGAEVFALRDPRGLACDDACVAACGAIDGTPGAWSLDQVRAWNRCRTRGGRFAGGTALVESQTRADPGTDPIRDGRFALDLPPGDYLLVAVDGTRPTSPLEPVTVTAGGDVATALSLPDAGQLAYTIRDELGRDLPGKITIGQLPGNACATDDQCGRGQYCLAGECGRPWGALLPLELGGRRPVDGVLAGEVSATGHGTIALPPGDYDVVVSRGPFYSIDRRRVTIAPRLTTQLDAAIRQVVDHRGWISAGLHTHAESSIDCGVPMPDRVASFLAEDMDLLAATDHDWITDYAPLVKQEGASDRLATMPGVEVTTQEYGHYLAFPLRPRAFSDGTVLTGNDAVQWRGLPPQQIIDAARARAADGTPALIDIPHPYDYFDFYRVDPVTLEPGTSLLVIINPLLDPALFTGDFEVMELANTKNYSRLRRATLGETAAYGEQLDQLIDGVHAGTIDGPTFDRRWLALTTESTRARLHRTVAEQEASLAGDGAGIACECAGDGMCGAGLVCEKSTMTCVPAPGSAAPAPPPDGLCRWSRGILDDWFNMLDRGVVRTGVGGGDSHDLEDGYLRTMLRTGATTPPYANADSAVEAMLAGRAIVTTGPMVDVTANGAAIGDLISAPPGAAVDLAIRVEKAPWYDVDRLEVYRNGHLIAWANGCDGGRGARDADPDPLPCLTTGDAVVAWDQHVIDHPDRDAWYVVLVYGLDGRTLAPVYQTQVLAEINTPDITARLFQVVPGLREFLTPRQPGIGPTIPMAFTNPIWVDVGGDGWTPSLPPPSWCQHGDFGCPK